MEPYEGWINGISTVAVFALGIKFGIFGSLRADKDCVLDVMPVDIVANSIIVAASLNSRNNFKIYNCTSGSINPIKIGSYFECLKKHTNYEGVIRNRPFVNPSFIGHKLHRLFLNHLPCLILDLVRWICCRKPIYMRKSSKFLQGADVLEFFTKNEWNFEAENFKNLIQYAKEQGGNFDCDIEKLQWDDFIRKSVNGMDKFLLGSR
jgi:fatty acyl-CoA reductase